jgi:transcriptional regulator with XRE-family HTH domain
VFNFGTHLKMLRQSKNITQRQLAENIGASERGIQNYELSTRKPTYDTLIALADYFDVSIDYLVGRSDVKERR